MFPPSNKRKGGGGGGERDNFSMRSKQIKHSNDHIKENQVRKGGGGEKHCTVTTECADSSI